MVSLLSHHIYMLCAPRVFSAPSLGVSLWRLWLCSWCCLEVRVRNTCTTLGGLLSSVLVVSFLQCVRGVRWSLQGFSLLCPSFFVPYGWLAYLHCGVERVILYGFQLLLARKVRLLVDG